jgi:hypothetical protein
MPAPIRALAMGVMPSCPAKRSIAAADCLSPIGRQQAALAALAGKQLLGNAPMLVGLAVHREDRNVGHGQQPQPVQLRPDTRPFLFRIGAQPLRRRRAFRPTIRLRLLADPALAGIAAQNGQVGRRRESTHLRFLLAQP